MKRPDTPFPRHWRYYIVLKYVVLAAAIALALKYFGESTFCIIMATLVGNVLCLGAVYTFLCVCANSI